MQALKFLMKYGWIGLLAICLTSYVPLALNAEMVGGIPNWVYWTLSLFLTLVLVVWAILGSVFTILSNRRKTVAKTEPKESKSGSVGHGGAVAAGL